MAIRLTRFVKILLIASFAAFIIQQTVDLYFGGNLLGWFGLIPAGVVLNFRIWQLFTYSFLHADVMHLFLNLMMLAFIGSDLESSWGSARFLRYYFTCTVSAGLIYLLLQLFTSGEAGLHTPMIGASAGIYGLLVAYGIVYGERVMLFMMLFPLKAKHFVWILAGIELMSTVFSARGGLAGLAHLAGMGTGFCYLFIQASMSLAKRRREQGGGGSGGREKPRKAAHLKLVSNNQPNVPPRPKSLDTGRKSGGFGEKDEDDDPKIWH